MRPLIALTLLIAVAAPAAAQFAPEAGLSGKLDRASRAALSPPESPAAALDQRTRAGLEDSFASGGALAPADPMPIPRPETRPGDGADGYVFEQLRRAAPPAAAIGPAAR